MNNKYPEAESPLPATDSGMPNAMPTFHQRFRVVVPCCDEEQATRLAKKIAEFCSCDLELYMGITDTPPTKVLSETVLFRTPFHVDFQAAKEDGGSDPTD